MIWKCNTLLTALILLSSCSNKKFENFDDKSWKADKKGCKGHRKMLVEQILKRKQELYGFTELEVLKSFGTPDLNDLKRRQQKIYHYFTAHEDHCSHDSLTLTLKLKFNALDQVQDIVYE